VVFKGFMLIFTAMLLFLYVLSWAQLVY
jgi:hypothetical protein